MPDLENNLAIIGKPDSIMGFKALGFKLYPANGENYKALLEQVILDKPAVCLVEENIYKSAKMHIDDYRSLPFPIFIPLGKEMAFLDNLVKDIRLKATGTF